MKFSLLKPVLAGLLALLAGAVVYLGVQSIRLNWWATPESTQLRELTAEQKAADMQYLLDLTSQVSQADAVWQAAGLDNPLAEHELWIERARRAESNSAFADLILQYLVHVGQGGHAFLAYDATFNPITSLVSDAPRDAFYNMPRWGTLISRLPWYAHADLALVYRDGQYLLDEGTRLDGHMLPAGAVVEQVDGLETDAFVLQQQYRAHLRYDPTHDKFFIYPLLMIDPGPAQSGWHLTFRLPDGMARTVFVPKIRGYVDHRPVESQAANLDCQALADDLLYIRVMSFAYEHASQDALALRGCFAPGTYQTAIFDLRGNSGGEIWSYMDNIMAPLAREPVSFTMTSAVKDSFYHWYGWRFWLFQATNNNELSDQHTHIVASAPIDYLPYSDAGWQVRSVTRRIAPAAEPFPFHGRVYILIDNDARSAADSFAAAMQRSGLATVVGTNTAGWGQAYQAKMLYALPNSGMLFFLDAELTINPDGTLNNYAGVMPDVFLSASSFPTPYPASRSRAAILADPWVQWVLTDRLENEAHDETGPGRIVHGGAPGP